MIGLVTTEARAQQSGLIEKARRERTGESGLTSAHLVAERAIDQETEPAGSSHHGHDHHEPGELDDADDELFPDEDTEDEVALPDTAKRRFTRARRQELARAGMALPDGSYPVVTAEDLENAAAHVRLGHGDVRAARRLIARRAAELGVKNPLKSEQASKAALPGHAAESSGSRSPAAGPIPESLAGHRSREDYGGVQVEHVNLQQLGPGPLADLRTAQPDNASGSSLRDHPGQVRVESLSQAAASAGIPLPGAPSGNPASRPGGKAAPTGRG
jgi:hypothetical protein